MKRATATVLIIAGLIAMSAAIAAARHHAQRAEHRVGRTFSGSCAFSGTVRFQPALTNTPQRARDVAHAHGTCSGTLTGRRGRTRHVDAAPVRYVAWDIGDASCALGADATGGGRLVFPAGALRFKLTETRAAALASLSLTGARGGRAEGQANVNTDADPLQVAQACAGNGLSAAPVDIRIQTGPAITG